jgi:hypothetical protein
MKDAWAAQTELLAKVITQWVGSAIPAITQLGSSIMTWFGERLPGVLKEFGRIFLILTPSFEAFGQFLGAMFDRNVSKMAPLIEAFVQLGLVLAEGLLTNLERLSNWFIDRLPTYGPIVSQIFGAIGGRGRGCNAGVRCVFRLGSFALEAIVDGIANAWNSGPGADFKKVAETDLPKLRDAFESLVKNSPNWIPPLEKVAAAFLDIATAVAMIADNLSKLAGWMDQHPVVWDIIGGKSFSAGSIIGRAAAPSSAPPASHGVPHPATKAAIVLNVTTSADPNAIARTVGRQLRELGAV